MSEKRRDRKNRILRSGESQRRDGRYVFKYMDKTGKPQFIYSWKLEKTDKIPGGKRKDLSLREKEKLIMKDIADDIVPRGGEMTVQQLVEKYLSQKTGVRDNTENSSMIFSKSEAHRASRFQDSICFWIPRAIPGSSSMINIRYI